MPHDIPDLRRKLLAASVAAEERLAPAALAIELEAALTLLAFAATDGDDAQDAVATRANAALQAWQEWTLAHPAE